MTCQAVWLVRAELGLKSSSWTPQGWAACHAVNFPEPHWKAEGLPEDRREGGQEMPGLALQPMAAGSHPTGLERQGLVPTAPDCGQ